MNIRLDHKTTVKDIQDIFCLTYPFLQIRFSAKPHHRLVAGQDIDWFASHMHLVALTKKKIADSITLRPWYQTGDVEQEFEAKLGLHAEIFRKEGEQWIKTNGTDSFTLFEQNEIGMRNNEEQHINRWIEREKLL